MPSQLTLFISHVSEDETIALAVKSYLESVFLNTLVFVSGRDLSGGEVWVEELRAKLQAATAIVAIMSDRSIDNTWVYFEAGTGFLQNRTIPLRLEDVSIEDLGAPLNLLQVRKLDEPGLQSLARDISKLAGMRSPVRFPMLKQALRGIQKFRELRAQEEESTDDGEDEAPPDSELKVAAESIQTRAVGLVIKAIKRHKASFDIPPERELKAMNLLDLTQLAKAVGAQIPLLMPLLITSPLPAAAAPEWRKVNARAHFESLRRMLDELEASLKRRATR
jgi:hypothetical protein